VPCERILTAKAVVRINFVDIVEHSGMAYSVFAGRETGSLVVAGAIEIPLSSVRRVTSTR